MKHDNSLIEIGDELPLKVEGFVVGKARVVNIVGNQLWLSWGSAEAGIPVAIFDYEQEEY